MPRSGQRDGRDRVAAALMAHIRAGAYSPGGKLPSEAELSREYGVHRLTARAALERLAEGGLIYSRARKGWFVRDNDRLLFPLMSIDQGRITAPKDVWGTFLDRNAREGDAVLETVTVDRPPSEVATQLNLGPDGLCAIRPRIRRVEGRPWMRSTGYFPMDIAEGTDLARDVDMQSPSPLALLIQMGHEPVADIDVISGRMPTPEEIGQLDIPRGVPVLINLRTSWDAQGQAVRCTLDVIPAHRFELTVEQRYGKDPR